MALMSFREDPKMSAAIEAVFRWLNVPQNV